MKNTKNRFQHYLSHLGDLKASESLAISERSAQAYRLGERRPRPRDIEKIMRAANGSLSYACFFEPVAHE
jgi:hypothetical protein